MSKAEKKISILVIDDDQLIHRAIEKMLFEKNVVIDFSTNAQDAIEKTGDVNSHYDVIICDLHMPKVDGVELSKQLYEDYPIVLLTGFLEKEFEKQIVNICDSYLEKLDAGNRIYPALLKAIQRKLDRSSLLSRSA